MRESETSVAVKTGRWGGVVTAFITMSDIKDEIDWEFPGNTTTEGQSNFFWQGYIRESYSGVWLPALIRVYPAENRDGGIHGNLSDTFSNFHEFTFDWQEDALNWQIDGQTVRTLKRSDVTGSDGVAHYPSTPSRIQLRRVLHARVSSPSADLRLGTASGPQAWRAPARARSTGQVG